MGQQDFTRKINIYIESGQAQVASDVLNKKLDATLASIKKITDAGKDIPAKLTKQLEDVTAAIDRQNKKLTGELSPSYRDLTAAASKLNNELARMSEEDAGFAEKKEAADKAKKAVDEYAKSVGIAKGKMSESGGEDFLAKIAAGFGIGALAEKGVEKVVDLTKEAIDEALQLEKAQTQLRNSLDNYGRSDALPKLKEQMEKLADRFKYFTETQITQAQEKLVQFGKLSLNQINQLMPVLLNYAAKTGITVEEAADDITRGLFGLEGSGKRLHEMGIEIDKAGNVAKNFNIIMKDLKVKVQDAGDAFSTTRSGKIQTFFTQVKEDAMHAVDAISIFLKFTTADKTQLELLQETKTGFDLNTEALKNSNLTAEARKKLIDETNSKYKEYLPNLLSEKSSIDDINKAQELGNKLLLTKILTISYEKELKEIIEDQKDSIEKLTNAQIQQAKLKANGAADMLGLSPAEIEEQKKLAQTAESINAQIINNTDKRVTDLKDKFKLMAQNAGVAFDEIMKGMKGKSDNQALFDPTGGKGVTNAQKEAYMKFLQNLAALRREAAAAAQSADEAEIQRAQEKYTALENEAKIYFKHHVISQKQLDSDIAEIEKIAQQDIANIKAKQEAKNAEASYKLQQDSTKKFYDDEKALAAKNFAEKVISKQEYDTELLRIDQGSAAVLLLNFQSHYEERQKLAKKDVKVLEELAHEKLLLETNLAQATGKVILDEAQRRRDAIKAGDTADVINAQLNAFNIMGIEEARLKQLKDNLAIDLALNENNEAKKKELYAKYAEDRKKIEGDTLKAISGYIQQYQGYAVNIWTSLNSIAKNLGDARLAQEQRTHDASVKKLDNELKSKVLSQTEHDKRVASLDEALDKKKHELDVKQFKRQQALDIAKAIMAGGTASMNAWAEYGWPWALIPQAFIIAETAAEVSMIATQQPPSMGTGTESWRLGMGGDPHSAPSGGNPVIDPNTGQVIAKVERKEAILPADSSEANQPAIRWMIQNRGKVLPNLNFNRATENIRFANGTASFYVPGTADMPAQVWEELIKKNGNKNRAYTGDLPAQVWEELARRSLENSKHIAEMAMHVKNIKVNLVKYDQDLFEKRNDASVIRTSLQKI